MVETKKKILVFNILPLFPQKAMNLVRTLHMIKSLSRHFDVDVITGYWNKNELPDQFSGFENIKAVNFIPLNQIKRHDKPLMLRLIQVYELVINKLFDVDKEYTFGKLLQKSLLKQIHKENYDFIISNYWQYSSFFKYLPKGKPVKILDTHYSVIENIEVLRKNGYAGQDSRKKSKELNRSILFEEQIIKISDVILSLSKNAYLDFKNKFPAKNHFFVADGNDINHFTQKMGMPDENTILFYGSMGSKQNQGAFKRFYYNILPLIKAEIPDLKVLVVGAKPPEWIQKLHDGNKIIVTGFVDDVRDYLKKGLVMLLPLEIGSGFRGRIVEVMAMGIPVIGTHNALDSIEMISGKHGLVTDSNQEMASFAIKLIKDPQLRKQFSDSALEFVQENYSIEATFDKLTEYLLHYE